MYPKNEISEIKGSLFEVKAFPIIEIDEFFPHYIFTYLPQTWSRKFLSHMTEGFCTIRRIK